MADKNVTIHLTQREMRLIKDVVSTIHRPGASREIENSIVSKLDARLKEETRMCACLIPGDMDGRGGARWCYVEIKAPMSVTLCSSCQAEDHGHGY